MSNTKSVVGTVVLSTAAAAASVFLYQSISEYGFQGTLRYIWEGEPYNPRIRTFLNTLEKAAKEITKQQSTIASIEEALERARLNSVDGASSTQVAKIWVETFRPKNLEKALAQLDNDIDKISSMVDGVVLAGDDSAGAELVKNKKKSLSKNLLLAGERTDALLASYKVLQEDSTPQ
jgi:hypothetical protein